MSFQLFEDTNANGYLDGGEKVLVNKPVKLDNFVAVTDKNGKVYFQNVPTGSYILKIQESAEARLMMDPVIEVNQNLKLQVGLIKNNKITGRLVEIKQNYDKLETFVRGVVIYARDEQGNIFTTLVNQNDEFEFFLGNGRYQIYIGNDKYEYIDAFREITVENADYPQPLIFEYKKKDTEIKVKKF